MRVLFIGRLVRRKGIDVLLKSANILISNNDVTFHLYGTGDTRFYWETDDAYVAQLKEDIRNLPNVTYHGGFNETEVADILGGHDVLVVPSTLNNGGPEGWGLVVGEACSCSLPVISSDMVGCVDTLINHEENGFVFTDGDSETLAGYLSQLSCHLDLRIKFGEASFKRFRDYIQQTDHLVAIRTLLCQ